MEQIQTTKSISARYALEQKATWHEWLNHKYFTRVTSQAGRETKGPEFENCPGCKGLGFVPYTENGYNVAASCPICAAGQFHSENTRGMSGKMPKHQMQDNNGDKLIMCQFKNDCPFDHEAEKHAYCNLVVCKFDDKKKVVK